MDNIFAVNLKNLRIEKGLNQTELAEKLFINKSMISSYEKGTRMPSLDILMQLTFIFDESYIIVPLLYKASVIKTLNL